MNQPVRNPSGVIAALLRGLTRNPELRACQLISNALYAEGLIKIDQDDIFYIEDNRLIEALDTYYPGKELKK